MTIGLFGFMVLSGCLTLILYFKKYKEANDKLAKDNIKVVSDNKKISLEYLALKEMWVRLEKQAAEVMKRMGRPSSELDFADLMDNVNVPETEKFDVDDILNEINEKGISNVDKNKIKFLENFNKK